MKKKGFILGNLAGIVASCAILITVNVLALTTFKQTITTFLGGSGLSQGETGGDSYENAGKVVDQIEQEGIVLLKNENNALPLGSSNTEENVRVNVFGYDTINTYYGGSGSGASSVEDAETYLSSYTASNIEYNQDIITLMQDNASTVDADIGEPLRGTFYPAIPELTVDLYQAGIDSYKSFSDIAIINIGRTGGEGLDLPSGNPGEFRDHSGTGVEADYLALSQNEQDLIKLCEENFGTVIVCVNAANPVELGILEDAGVDAALWIGHPGAYGLSEVGKILRGTVNPSGRLVDTYAYDSKAAPSYYNFGQSYSRTYPNIEGSYYVDYQEGIYVGYRYFETKYDGDEEGYQEAVLYPFGYGLSYTTFNWEVASTNFGGTDGNIEIQVRVTNTGSVAGKDVVEVYYEAPYTSGGIEKSTKVLADFAKTSLLEPNASETVTLSFAVSDMASYDYNDANNNNHTGYELESGTYNIYVSENSHVAKLDALTYEVAATTHYDTSSTGYTVENRFEDANGSGEINYITRADNFTSNFPDGTASARNASTEVLEAYNNQTTYTSDDSDPAVTTGTITAQRDRERRDENGEIVRDENGNIVYETTTDENGNQVIAKRGLYLEDMAGLEYDDPLWEDILNQLTVDEMAELIAYGGYQTYSVESINKSLNRDLDGPQGFNFSNVSGEDLKAMSYPSEIVVASTWNKDLAFAEGAAFGAEANDMGVTSVYAPAVNIHRTTYGGRNFEYYSEDPLLSGYMGEKFVEGANTYGLNCYVKHFALNDQEYQRAGLFTWCNEQAIREIYLKPFKMTVEIGKTCCIMSSFNRIGATWSGGNYNLLTEVLRNEWGFKGMVVTDYYMMFYTHMDPNVGIRAGNDCWLTGFTAFGQLPDLTTNTSQKYARNACHNILYAVANARSSSVSLNYSWLNWFIPADVILWVAVAVWAGIIIYKGVKANSKKEEVTEGN